MSEWPSLGDTRNGLKACNLGVLNGPRILTLLVLTTLAPAAPVVGQQVVIPDSQAASQVGQTVTVEGSVASVHVTRSGTVFLNFGAAYPEQTFTAVIFRSAASRFPNPEHWDGKRVRVTGPVRLYRGRPEIILEEPSRLVVAPE